MRFVSVPKPLTIEKNGEATRVILKKSGDTIAVVALR
jgi:hypothetical protein